MLKRGSDISNLSMDNLERSTTPCLDGTKSKPIPPPHTKVAGLGPISDCETWQANEARTTGVEDRKEEPAIILTQSLDEPF